VLALPYCFSRFNKYRRVTDVQTDGQTDRITVSVSRTAMLIQYAIGYAMLSATYILSAMLKHDNITFK